MHDDREHPLPGNVLRVADFEGYEAYDHERPVGDLRIANVLTSEVEHTNGKMHRPVLDIDVPIKLIPSSTNGHSHLYIMVPMTYNQMLLLMDTLVEVGILEPGYVSSSKKRGYSAVRLPWITKAVNL